MMKRVLLFIGVLLSICSGAIPLTDLELSTSPVTWPIYDDNTQFIRYMPGDVPTFPSDGIYLLKGKLNIQHQYPEVGTPTLFIPPMPFPVTIRINGMIVYQWGYLDKSTCIANFSASHVPLRHFKSGNNFVEIFFYTDGQPISIPTFYVGDQKQIERNAFWQSLWNHSMVQAIAIMALFSCLIFMGHAASSRFKERDILYFSLITLMIFFGYTPFIFNYPQSIDTIWFKFSRIGYILISFFLLLFCQKFTNITAGKMLNSASTFLMIPFILLILTSTTKSEINKWFGLVSILYLLPVLFISFFIFVRASITKRKREITIISTGYSIFMLGVIFDLTYVFTKHEPYVWLTPYAYFILICTIIFAIYVRQNIMHKELIQYKAELLYTNQSLLRAHTRLVTESAMKEQFIRAIAHEFRTPLNGMVGIIDSFLTESREKLSESMHNNALLLGSSFHRFELTVQNLIDYQELQNDDIKLELHTFSPELLMNQLVDYCSGDAKLKSISLISLVNREDLPPCLIGDSTRIAVIINNLLRNAIKFTDKGGVSAKLEYESGILIITIADTGCGIDQAIQEKVFEAFSRGEKLSFTQRYEGVGLGLAIVDALTKRMNGSIIFTSEKGRGTQFIVRLPITLPANKSQEITPLTVLVVDDNVVNRTVLINQLEKMGHTVLSAENGEDAVYHVVNDDTTFDVVLMDIQMPVMDGYEASRIIRDRNPYLPIIGVTANGDRELCIASGMNDVMFKPTSPDILRTFFLKYVHK